MIYGDGEQTPDFTYIDDVVEANLELLENGVADGQTVNIGSTENITLIELAELVIAERGFEGEPVYTSAKEAEGKHTQADVSKAGRLLGYEPRTCIREGVSQFIDWYRENWDWYEPLVKSS